MVIFFIMIIILAVLFAVYTYECKEKEKREQEYRTLESEVLRKLGYPSLRIIPYIDEHVVVKSRQALEKYDKIKFFKDNREKLVQAKNILKRKEQLSKVFKEFVKNNEYKGRAQYDRLEVELYEVINSAAAYRIEVKHISSAGNLLGKKQIIVKEADIERFEKDPSILMTKGEYSKFIKEQQKEALAQKQHKYYERVNKVVDYANEKRDSLFIKGSAEQLDGLVDQLFDRTVNSIKKIKSLDSEEWEIIDSFVSRIENEMKNVVDKNHRILEYYEYDSFLKIKETCEALMSTQREFNEYITEKVKAVSQLFGVRVVRNETVNEDEYQYIRPYRKTITPFTAEVSAAVFASAENNPLEYVIKNFYSNKQRYPEQIQKLHLLVEELATLKDAKRIIDNYKVEYQLYIVDVPKYVMNEDEVGFYSRLGFANVDESVLSVEYRFSYTSGGGMAKRSFTVPMTEETIVELIKALEEKLTVTAFTKEQRALMTNKLREFIKTRDNFTCCSCGNSIYVEPNLLLEIDHIIPVSKGGYTVEENLQTLCWKCNRVKSNKLSE